MTYTPEQNPYNPVVNKKKKGPDVAVVGFLLGLLFPVLALVLLYFFWFGDYTFANYISMFGGINNSFLMNNASKAISLAMISNLMPLYFFLNRKKYLTVRGILMASVLFCLLIVLYKFVWQ